MGRHKTIISDEDMAIAEQYAKEGCLNGTIAGLMGWEHNFLEDRPDIRKKLTKKRQEGKAELHKAQYNKAIESKDTTMQIWLGKNRLGQTDRVDKTSGGERIQASPVIINVDGRHLKELGAKPEDLIPVVD